MKKRTVTIPVGKILSVLGMAESVCAGAVVQKAVKLLPMNPIVKAIGGGAIQVLVQAPFAVSAGLLWNTDTLDYKFDIGTDDDENDQEQIEGSKEFEDLMESINTMSDEEIEALPIEKRDVLVTEIFKAAKMGLIKIADMCTVTERIYNPIKTEGEAGYVEHSDLKDPEDPTDESDMSIPTDADAAQA